MVVADAERGLVVERESHAEIEADHAARRQFADRFALAVEDQPADVAALEGVDVADAAEENRRIGRKQPRQARLRRVEAGAGRQLQRQAGAGDVFADAALGAVGDDAERIAPGARLEAQTADVVRLVRPARVELVARRHFDVADRLAGRVEGAFDGGAGEDFTADGGVRAVHVRHLHFHFEPVRQSGARAERCAEGIALDLAHVDQADQQGGDDRVADQRHPVARRVAELQRRLQHILAFLGQHAGLLEQRRNLRRPAVPRGRLADRLLRRCRCLACAAGAALLGQQRRRRLLQRAQLVALRAQFAGQQVDQSALLVEGGLQFLQLDFHVLHAGAGLLGNHLRRH